ncbi:MAG: subtilisin-like proprotein convertase family protein [Saprospiraceae bacterium]|jgi:subtilisin-like proprotein convertase family protein
MNWRLKEVWLLGLFIMCHLTIWSQKSWLATSGGPLESVDLVELELEGSNLLATKRSVEGKEGAFHFAHEIRTKISIQEAGTWEYLDNGKMLWRQRIQSKGAYSLNLAFKDFHLPSSASLFLYDFKKTHVIGPITQEDNDTHGEWWSPIIPFDEVIIEIQVSAKEASLLKTTITEVNHDFQGFGALLSGSCNIDVACGAEEGFALIDLYRNIINSVGMYSINGREICTGVLINNVRNDCTPYFLTAKHCEVTENNAASVVVYWNYQQTTCRTPGSTESGAQGDGPRNMFNSGVSLLSEYDNSDMSLLLLDDPVAPEVDAFFAGWDATGNVLDSAICVHHPQAEEKRISFDYNPSTPYFLNQFYRVLDWDEGTTESGSSGAPLFSTNNLIVGQLNGGAASCGNEEYDDFGMLAISWEGGGTRETNLKSWLDPDNTGVLTFGGRSCSDLIRASSSTIQYCTLESRVAETIISIQSGYESGAILSIQSISDDISAIFSQEELTPSSPNAIVTIELAEDFNQTSSILIIAINSSEGEDLLNIKIEVDNGLPSLPVLSFPRDDASNVSYDIELIWGNSSPSSQIEIYEVRDDDSQSLVISETLEASLYPIRSLKNNTTYRWRVRGRNSCGFGVFSSFFTFSTGNISCSLLNDEDLPQSIETELDTIRSTITVEQEGSVVDVNVINVRGKHTFVGDLSMELRSPSGSIVELLSFKCQDADDFLVSFDEESDVINTPCPINSQVPQRPAGSLSDITGESAKGDWTLTIYDDVREDGGSFDSWSLELCILTEEPVERSISLEPSFIEVCEKAPEESLAIEGTISGGYSSSVSLEVLGSSTNDISINPNPVTGSGTRSFVIVITNTQNLLPGSILQLLASDELGVDTVSIAFESKEIPEIPVLSIPTNNLVGVDLEPSFSWNSTRETIAYNIKIGTDTELMNLVLDTIITTPDLDLTTKLNVDTDYFWNVTSQGKCTDVTSEVFAFRTTLINATIDVTLQEIKLYPNPVSSNLSLEIPSPLRNRQLAYELVNSLGQVIEARKLSSPTTMIEMSSYSSGLYYVKIVSDRGLWTQAIFKL